jgi:hypothetical protein
MKASRDIELMSFADGETGEHELEDLLRDPKSRSKVEAVTQLGELVRGHLELSADALPQKKLDALWREIDKGIDRERASAKQAAPQTGEISAARAGWLRRVGRWFEHHRGHVITGAVSAGAVAALALVLRPGTDGPVTRPGGPVETMPVMMPAEIQSLDTPGGTGTVFNMEDEDGSTTVIWVTPEDTVEGI